MTHGEVVTLSLFRFDHLREKLWAFSQMQFAHKSLRALPDLRFYKLFGSGSGEGFTPWPNFGVYGILTVWPSLERARFEVEGADLFKQYYARSCEQCAIYLTPHQVHGTWDHTQPFSVNQKNRTRETPEPIAVLTRATIKKSALLSFWSRAPAISKDTVRQDALNLKIGLGEIPWLHQVTFSIWSNKRAMVDFAHKKGCHALAARDALSGKWFAESLFARFAIVNTTGRWEGSRLIQTANGSPAEL